MTRGLTEPHSPRRSRTPPRKNYDEGYKLYIGNLDYHVRSCAVAAVPGATGCLNPRPCIPADFAAHS